jgi:arginase family enzyme
VGVRTTNAVQQGQIERFRVRVTPPDAASLAQATFLEGPTYVSLDIDALDPAFAPGVSHHEPGGLSTRDVLAVLRQIEAPLVGADIVEYNPSRDINGVTAVLAAKLVKEVASLAANRT